MQSQTQGQTLSIRCHCQVEGTKHQRSIQKRARVGHQNSRTCHKRDFLVRAKLPQAYRGRGARRGDQPGFKKCGKARCLCCVYSSNTRTHTSTLTGQTWPIKQSITCDDHSVVYNVTCSHQVGPCLRRPAQYVGKVGATRACRVRCTEHRRAARNHFHTAVGDHFNLPGHEVADFNFLPYEIRCPDPFVIEARENKTRGKLCRSL